VKPKFIVFASVLTLFFFALIPVNTFAQQGIIDDVRDQLRGAGVHGGASLDPELFYVGAHAWFGPVIRDLWIRPSIDYGFGEVTKLVSINPEAVYVFAQDNGLNFYAGAGFAYMVLKRGYELREEDIDIEFDDWSDETGANLIIGMTDAEGFMAELRAGAYGSPGIKIIIGYTF